MGMVKFVSKIPWKTRISRKNSAPYGYCNSKNYLNHGWKWIAAWPKKSLWYGLSVTVLIRRVRNKKLTIKDLKQTMMAAATRTWHNWRFPEQNKSSAYVLCSLPIHSPTSMSGETKLLKYVLECWSMLPNPPSPALPPRRTCCKATCHCGSFFSLFWAQQVKEIFQNQSSHPFTCWIFKNSKQL